MINWEEKITEIRDKYEITEEMYNNSEVLRECVARYLGFPSFESFQSFPDPKYIIQDMGSDILSSHNSYQKILGISCVEEINRSYFYEQDVDLLHKQTDYFLKYMLNNFDFEISIVTLKYLIENIDILDKTKLSYWGHFSKELDFLDKIN